MLQRIIVFLWAHLIGNKIRKDISLLYYIRHAIWVIVDVTTASSIQGKT